MTRGLTVSLVACLFLVLVCLFEDASAEPRERIRGRGGNSRRLKPPSSDKQKVHSIKMHPTAGLMFESGTTANKEHSDKHRRVLRDALLTTLESAQGGSAGIYASLVEVDVPSDLEHDAKLIHEHNAMVKDFNSMRHLSRYELQHRQRERRSLRNDMDWRVLDNNGNNSGGNGDQNKPNNADENNKESDFAANHKKDRPSIDIISKGNDDGPGGVGRISDGKQKGKGKDEVSGGLFDSFQVSPLFQGYGTHYSSVWIGTPNPQRVSVIVDTGSHLTAFPCEGCTNCGEQHHTDRYFNQSASVSFKATKCGECRYGARCVNNQCAMHEGYAEGSSWQAFQAMDKFFCGGSSIDDPATKAGQRFVVDFMFGCQISEKGLFVTQLADGIMGMSQDEDTLAKQMYEQGVIEHNMFTMCFKREPHVSKSGITAGMITLGGIDSRLHSSPMVFAKNKVQHGWFTVVVKRVFLRASGGVSSLPRNKNDAPPKELKVNIGRLNTGKGIIVDSGTTDSYFHPDMGKHFLEEWHRMTGRAYANKVMKITREEVEKLPTLLLQIKAFRDKPDESVDYDEPIPGMVGTKIDKNSPHDVLLAIPALHYMEYTPKEDGYTPRIYFTESHGGVIGANAMQGHDILFDWENGRVGFAESSCNYADLEYDDPYEEGEEVAFEGEEEVDCRLGKPLLRKACGDSVDLGICRLNTQAVLKGFEEWSRVVENEGTANGKSCPEVIMEYSPQPKGATVTCDNKGLCTLKTPCTMTCDNAEAEGLVDGAGGGEPGGDDDDVEKIPCGDNFWGACEYSCFQTQVTSFLDVFNTSTCVVHDVDYRMCHIDACGRYDPCIVPFRVHVLFGFHGVDYKSFDRRHSDIFAEAIVEAASVGDEDKLFFAGDVKVVSVSPWHKDEEEETDESFEETSIQGTKIVCEISIFNAAVELPEVHITLKDAAAIEKEEFEGGSALETFKNKFKNIIKRHSPPPRTHCKEADLLAAAGLARDVHKKLERDAFMKNLVEKLQETEAEVNVIQEGDDSSPNQSPFSDLYSNEDHVKKSFVLGSWTKETEVRIPLFQRRPSAALIGFGISLALMCCCGIMVGILCCGPRGDSRGEYKKLDVGSNKGNFIDDDDDEHEAFDGDRPRRFRDVLRDDDAFDDDDEDAPTPDFAKRAQLKKSKKGNKSKQTNGAEDGDVELPSMGSGSSTKLATRKNDFKKG